VTSLSTLRPLIRTLSFLVALLVAGAIQGQANEAPATAFAAETLSLTPGASLEREIRGGETLSFDFPLAAGTFFYLEIAQRGVSISSKVSGAGGETLAEGQGPQDPGSHLLTMIAERTDTYRLDVTGLGSPKLSGRVKLRVLALRRAAAGDELRIKGAKALMGAQRLLVKEDDDSGSKALGLMEEALVSWQAAGDGRGEVEALVAIANFQEERENPQLALIWHQKAFDRAREIGFVEGEAWALIHMGYCNSRLGDPEQAVTHLQRSLQIWQQIGGPYEREFALLTLGKIYEKKQDFQAAMNAYEEVQRLAEDLGDLVSQTRALGGMGIVYYRQYHFGKARETWERALDLSRQAGDVRSELGSEQNLAAVYQSQGQFQKALDMFIRVAARMLPRESGMTGYNMGNLYVELGNPEKALESYERSREAFHTTGDVVNEVNALVGTGRVFQQKGDARTALATYERARQLLPNDPGVLHSIGLAQIDLDNPREALSWLEPALDKARANQNRWVEAATLLAMGTAFRKLGQPDLASERLREAIASGNESGYQRVVALALFQRVLLSRERGHLEEALADIESASAIIESTRRNIAGDQLRTGFFAAKRTFYDLEFDLLLRLERAHPGRGYMGRALEASERARARGLLDLLAEGRIDLRQGLDPELRRREEDLAGEISRVQSALRAASTTPQRRAELRAELDTLDVRWDQLEVEIQTSNKQYAEVRYPAPLKPDEIQRLLLDDHTALLEYVLRKEGSTLIVLTRDTIETYQLPGPDEIAKDVQRMREAVERESFFEQRDYLESAFRLYRDLLSPAAAVLAGKSDLLIVPDGILNYVPFEALLTEPGGNRTFADLPYALRRYSIAYIPSASVLVGLREPRQKPLTEDRKQVVAFAPFAKPASGTGIRSAAQSSPSDPEARRWTFEPLPASRREIAALAELYPGAILTFVDGEASEEEATRNPAIASARRLHFATHAQIDERHPEYSALVLAERPGDDGLLQSREVFNLKLSADLAVLSACQTALGKEVTGEGLVGLTRAFFYAGVSSLVVSLWNVVDGPTPELMLDFYRELDHLQNKAQALRAAKLLMISRKTYSHPSYWAPFILLGEPR
jgi:CHAT domain-containing protein/Tfp pilus assembly protein PilF